MAVPFSTAARSSISQRNPVIVRSWNTHDGRGHPTIGNTAVMDQPPAYSQPYQ